jgi:PAS domain-containing protein
MKTVTALHAPTAVQAVSGGSSPETIGVALPTGTAGYLNERRHKLSSSGTGSREESFGATLSHTMRQRLIAALILAVLLEGTGRFLARHESFEPVVGHLLSIFAATLAGATVVLLVSRTCRGRTIPTIMIVAALALVTSTILHTTGSLSAFDDIPILGNRADYHRVTISIADIFGIAAWIFGFFGLVFEIHHAKTSLSLQHELLLAETRERTERALKQSEALFREVFEEADAGIVVLDPEATILQCNGTFCEELGLPTGAPTKNQYKRPYVR